MSEFTETIKVVVQSVFNSDGFDKLERRMANLMNTRDNLEKQFNRGIGMKNIKSEIEQVEDKFKEAGLQIQTFKDDVDDIQIRNDKGQFAGVESFSNSIDEMFEAEDGEQMANRIVNSSQIEENVDAAKNQLQELGFAFTDIETGEAVDIGEVIDRTADAANRLDKFGGFDQQNMMAGVVPDETDIENLGAMDRTLGESLQNFSLPENMDLRDNLAQTLTFDKDIDVAEGFPQDNIQGVGPDLNKGPNQFSVEGANVRTLGVLSTGMAEVGEAANTATTGVQRFSQNSLPEMDRSIGQVAQSTRGLQMRLLGLQFTMLTVAFIFGGVMASALGAVGAFQILGNTLKFLFLPTALDLLDPLLNLQDFVFGLDEETRRFIGTVFGAISVISIAIGLFAALAQPIVGLIGSLLKLGSAFNVLTKLGQGAVFLSSFGSTASGVTGTLSALTGGMTSVGGILATIKTGFIVLASAVSSIITPVLVIIGVLTALFVVFKRFPGITNTIVSAVTGALDFLFAYFKFAAEQVISIVKGLFNILTGLFTAGFALLTGDIDKAVRGLEEILFGIGQIFIEPFEDALNFLGNKIVPAFGDVAHDIITGLTDVLVGNAGVVKDAILSVVPPGLRGFARDALGGGTGNMIEEFVDNSVKGLDNMGENFQEFDFGTIGKDFKSKSAKSKTKKEKDSGNGFTVENLNTSLNINEGNESPRETSRRAGRELRRGMVNKESNFATGT